MFNLQFDQEQNNKYFLSEKPQESSSSIQLSSILMNQINNENTEKNFINQKEDQLLTALDIKCILNQQSQNIEQLSQMTTDSTIKKKKFINQIKNRNINSMQNNAFQSGQVGDLGLGEEIKDQENDLNQNNLDESLKIKIDKLFNNNKLRYNYSSSKYKIYQELLQKNYALKNYLDSGGQADIFDGYFQNNEGIKEYYVVKIYFEATSEEFQKEIQIMKSFEKPINVVKIIDSLQIEQFYILILEKCQYSLKQELNLFKEKKLIFSFDKLLQIVFDLLDGLIQFRVYNILHLDIKPANILISQKGDYCYSDFGTSFNLKTNKEIEVRALTKYYASPEQMKIFDSIDFQSDKSIDFQSDVYSLGKTLKRVIYIFKKVNQEMVGEIIENFDKIIDENMILIESSQRSNCQYLHKQFLQQLQVENYKQFLSNYQKKLKQITQLYKYDQNKDIPYFLQLDLSYNLINLDLIKNNKNQEQLKNEQNQNIEEQSDTQVNQNGLDELESFEMRKQIFQRDHPEIAASLHNVGQCYQNIGDNQNGLKYQIQSLEMMKQIFQGNHPIIAATLNNVGLCYMNLGDNQNGLKYQLESLEMAKQIFEGNHPSIASFLNNVGLCYQNLGDIQISLKYQLQSLEMMKQIFQGNHPDIATSLNNVGQSYKNLGDYQNSLKYNLESLEMSKLIFQGNHPEIATSLNNVGICYVDLGKNQFGLKYQLDSIEMLKQIFQGNHPKIATSLNNVGLCYMNLGDNQNGLKYFLESLEMYKQIFQGNHPNIAATLNNIGNCFINLEDYQNGHGGGS